MRLIEKLESLNADQAISMHVPGHKNNTIGNLNRLNLVHDKTEIQGLDNLHEPEEVLAKLNNWIAGKYDNYHAQILTNGSTTGIVSAILAMQDNANRYIVIGEAHKSVYHGIELAQSEPVKVAGLEHFELQKDDVVIATYPTYQGRTYDIDALIKYVHRHEAIIIVDEAHGAHFDITPNFPKSAMNYNADIVVQSYHKMLPALTMGSVIFSNDKERHNKLLKFISYIESSSPSYLVMASIELAHEFYVNYSDERFLRKRQLIIDALKNIGCIVAEMDDPTKLNISHRVYSNYDIEQAMARVNIYPEMTNNEGVLLILPLSHAGDTYPYELLLSRLSEIKFLHINRADTADITQLLNKICIQHIIPYPPGVPLIRKGEVITEEDIKSLIHLMANRVKIEGIRNNIDYYTDEEH